MKIILILVGLLLVALVALGLWAYTPDESRDVIAAKYGVGAGDFREIAGISVHLVESGPRDAPAVILLHGFGSSLETWDAWAKALSDTFHVVRFDWPGFGLTGLDPAGDYTDAHSVAFLLAVMDSLGLQRASLVANSMGGKFAWMAAATHPTRVDRLVLVSPDGFASTGFEYGKAPDVPTVMRLFPYVLPTALVRMSLAPAYGNPALITGSQVTRYRDFMRAPGTRAAMIERMRQVVLVSPRAAAASHPGADATPVGREGRNDPVRQRGRLSEDDSKRAAGRAARPWPRAAGRGACGCA